MPKKGGSINHSPQNTDHPEFLHMKDVFFRYDKKQDLILNELCFSLKKGEFYALMGGNGSGKSTLLKMMAGLVKPEQGKILYGKKPMKTCQKEWMNKIGYLPQNPKLFFIQDTVEKEIQEIMVKWQLSNSKEVDTLLAWLGIAHLKKSHPYDLSGGELQKSALACLLIRKPEVLLLDEPTKGLDPISKETFARILLELNSAGVTILMSTHDVEFAAHYASRCGMMFQGKVTSENTPLEFFKGNFFYTTMIQRIFRDIPEGAPLTLEEVIR